MSIVSIGEGIERIEDGMEVVDEVVHVPRFTSTHVQLYWPLFKYLNGKDRDIFYLFFIAGKKQKDVQSIMERSQPGLCYDTRVIRRRLKYIYYLNCIYDIYIDFLASDDRRLFEWKEIEVLTAMMHTTSYTMASMVTGMSQMTIRSLFSKSIEKMKKHSLWDMYEIFVSVRENLNILKRVYRKIDNQGVDVVPGKSRF